MPKNRAPMALAVVILAIAMTACASRSETDVVPDDVSTTTEAPIATTVESDADTSEGESEPSEAEDAETDTVTFTAEVWADNWFALYINGQMVAEDSVPITTERSFNSETITFEATYPLTIGLEAKDFTETNSGLEYIGEANQQMGDGGIIAQITDKSTGEVVAVANAEWTALVVYQAPLNTECVDDADPDATCEYLILDNPDDWATAAFDDSGWEAATEWSASAVDPKDGYFEIEWDPSAQFIWGTDLEIDNTVLLRLTVEDSSG